MLKKRSGKTLIFRMDKDEIRLAVLNLSSSDPVPEFTSIIETPEGAIEDGDIKRPDLLEQALQPVLAQAQYKRVKKAIFTICTGQVISETVTIPAVSEKKLEKMLQANLDMYFPVSTADHHLVYHVLDKKDGDDGKEMVIQLWAIPRDMVVSYYALANILGLGIVAMDYCGNSLVSGVGASFATPEARDAKGRKIKEKKSKREKKPSRFGKKKKEQDEMYQPEITPEGKVEEPAAEVEEAPPTELYLVLENEHIIATFVQNGRVKMQRVFLTGYSIAAELDEVRLTLDYFTTQENVDLDKMTAIVCGKLANDPLIMGDVESALDLPVVIWNCPGGPEWTLNVGAAKSQKDFGIPNLAKQMKGPSPVKTRWQVYVLLASMAMLTGTVITTTFSNLNWDLDLRNLDETLRILKIQEAQNNGNAERYYEYESKYDAYSYDWDMMFANLRTYNDNLAKMLEEIEQTIPKDAAVVTIGIANEGLGLQFACEDKEMAAYLIMSLRDLKYAELKDISNLSVGPGTTAQDMLPSLSRANQIAALGSGQSGLSGVLNGAVNGAVNGAINGAAGALNGSEATPPTGAADLSALLGMAGSSGIDLSKLTPEQQKQLMEMYMNGDLDSIIDGSGAIQVDPIVFMGQAIKSGDVTEEDMFAGMERLTGEQLDALDIAYSTTPDPKKPYTTIKYMRSHEPGIEARADAIEKMLTTDDFAVFRFHNAFLKDLSRKDDDSILFVHIKDDLRKSGSLFGDIISEDVQQMQESMPDLIEILTRDEQTIERTEDLFNTDTRLADKYLYYWAVEAGVRKADKDAGSIKMDVLMNDIVENDLANNTDELEEAVDALIMAVINNDPDLYKQWEKATGGSLDDEEEVIEDTRIHFAVALGYKEELIEAEQYHKGLPYYAKLNKVEVK